MSNFKAGDPLDPSTTHGPQADEIQYKRVTEYLKIAKEQDGKGKVEIGGGAIKMEGGNGVRPSLHTSSKPVMVTTNKL